MAGDEVHHEYCFCDREWCLEEPLEEEEAPIEERLKTLINLSKEHLHKKKGDIVDLEQLLFTQRRKHLVKSDGVKLFEDELSGKQVLLYIFPLFKEERFETRIILMTREFVKLYKLLKADLEIVFVGLGSDKDLAEEKKLFEECSCKMTWPFIPFEDHQGRDAVKSAFGFPERFDAGNIGNYPYCGIVNPNGRLIQSWAWDMLNYYGHDAFPFTDERIFSLYREEGSMFTKGVSLMDLLGNPDRDYVLHPCFKMIPIQKIEDKVVCIILDDPTDLDTSKIQQLIEDCITVEHRGKFIPLLVRRNFPDTDCSEQYVELEQILENNKKILPYSDKLYTIDYDDSSSRKIWRVILRRCIRKRGGAAVFNIVGPHGDYVDFHACSAMINYADYPFTLRKLAELDARKLQDDVTLEAILELAGVHRIQDNIETGFMEVFCRPDHHIPPAKDIIGSSTYSMGQLFTMMPLLDIELGNIEPFYFEREYAHLFPISVRRRVLVLFATHSCCRLGQFLRELPGLYKQKKGTTEEFEVIYIPLDCLQSDMEKGALGMPWQVFGCGRNEIASGTAIGKFCGIPCIAAFENGVLQGLEGHLHWKRDRSPVFPYISNNIEDECFYSRQAKLEDEIPIDYEFWKCHSLTHDQEQT